MSRGEQAELDAWMAGFFDGEGSSQLKVKKSRNVNVGYSTQAMASLRHSYIGSLYDAEGTLQLLVEPKEDRRLSHHVAQRSKLKMNESDKLIKFLKNYAQQVGFECNIYHKRGSGNRSRTFSWIVGDKDSIKTFLNTIHPYTIVKHKEIEIMLDKIIPMLEQDKHTNRRGFLEIMAWKDIMDSYKGGSRGKYNLRYFEDLWDMKLDKERAGLPDGWLPDYSRPQIKHATD